MPITANGRLRWIQHRERARRHVLRGELEQARLSYSSLLHTKTNSLRSRSLSDIHLELGHVLHLLGEDDGAASHYQIAQSYRPQAYQPHVRLAQLASSTGRIEEALTHYKHALFYNNTHRLSLHNIGSLSLATGDVESGLYYWSYAMLGHHSIVGTVIDTSSAAVDPIHDKNNIHDTIEVPLPKISWNNKVQLIEWMTRHILEGFVTFHSVTYLDRTATQVDITNFYLLQNMTESDRNLICGNALHEIAVSLASVGVRIQSERLLVKFRTDLYRNSLSFLPTYATLPIDDDPEEVVSRMQWSKMEMHRVLAVLRERGTGEGVHSLMDVIIEETVSYRRAISTVHPLTEHLGILRHRLSSSSAKNDNSLIDRHRILAEKMCQFSAETLMYHWIAPPIHQPSAEEDRKRRRDLAREKRRKRRQQNKPKNELARRRRLSVGIVYDVYRFGAETEMYRHTVGTIEMLLRDERFRVILYVPRKDIYGHYQARSLPPFATTQNSKDMTIVEIPFLHQVTAKQLPDVKREYTKLFFFGKEEQNTHLVRKLDILLLFAPLSDATIHYLGHSRIAPVQVGLSCGTSSSGLGDAVGHLDYFIEGDAFVRRDGHRSFTEQLVRLPHTGGILSPAQLQKQPEVKYSFHGKLILFSRYRYAVVLLSAAGTFQLHPEFDDILINILRISQHTHVLLVDVPDGALVQGNIMERTLGHNIVVSRIRSKMTEENDNTLDESMQSNEKDTEGKKNKNDRKQEDIRKRIRHITGLERSDYLSLLSAVNVVLDPGTRDGGGSEVTILSSLDALMVGTPIVTLHPVDEFGTFWQRLQPTSCVAGLLRSVQAKVASNCVAATVEEYVLKANTFLQNDIKSRTVGKIFQNNITPWIKEQNKEVEGALKSFLLRIGGKRSDKR